MGFFFCYANLDGTRNAASEVQISPQPTRVDYPTTPFGNIIETAGGTVVQQQPDRDSRVRAWEWVGYPGWFIKYQELWSELEPLRSRYRRQLSLSPYVYLKEDETGEFCVITPAAEALVTRTFPYFKCRVLELSRELRKDGGLVRYEVTRLAFTIDDATWNYLG
jgi:hypothetical protein